MNALKGYKDDNSESDMEDEVPMEEVANPDEVAKRLGMDLNPVSDVLPYASASDISKGSQIVAFDDKKKEISFNPKYDQLFKPEVGLLAS